MGDFIAFLIMLLFFGTPIAAVVWFFVSLKNFFSTVPFTEERKRAKILLIISGIVAGTLVAIILGIIALLALAIANM